MPDRDHNGSIPTSWLHVAGFIVVLWAAASDALAQARDVLVTEVRGTVIRPAAKGTQPVRALDMLKAGDRMRLSSDSQVGLFTSGDARLYVVEGPAEVSVGANGITANGKPAASRQLNDAYRNIKVSSPELVQGSLVMRGMDNARALAPQGAVEAEGATQFRWTPSNAAFTLEIATLEGDPVFKAEVRGGEFRLPENIALKAGTRYVWGIAPVRTGAAPADWTEFVIAPEITRSLAALSSDASSRALHALWLREQQLPRASGRILAEQPVAR